MINLSLEFNTLLAEDYCLKVADGTHDSPKEVEFGKKLVTSKNIIDGKLDLEKSYFISLEDYNKVNKRSKVDKWDILISMIGTVGEVVLIKEDPDFTIKNVGLLKNKEEINAKWLYYYLKSDLGQHQIKSRLRGTTQLYIPLKDLRNLKIQFPKNHKDMEKIVKILDNIDKKIEINKRINSNLINISKTIFRRKFINYEDYEDFKDTEYGRIPVSFEVVTLKEISKKIVCGKTPSTKIEENYGDKMPFITIPDMHNNVFVIETERKLSEKGIKSQINKILPKNSVCVSCIATAGLVSLTFEESQTNQQINSIICKDGISSFFMYLYLCELSEYIKILGSGGSTTLNLNKKEFSKIKIAIPDNKEMITFDEIIRPIFEKIKINQLEIIKLSKLRDTLLPKLMSGEIDVSKVNCDLN